jgi:hypothetical protein
MDCNNITRYFKTAVGFFWRDHLRGNVIISPFSCLCSLSALSQGVMTMSPRQLFEFVSDAALQDNAVDQRLEEVSWLVGLVVGSC